MQNLPGIRRVAGVPLALVLAACSSGGAEDQSRRTEISARSMNFTAAVVDTAAPGAQSFTATFGADVANVSVIHTGAAIASVTSSVTGRTAQITIEPNTPARVGAGVFTGSVAITGYFCADPACSRVEAGNSQTVTVSYQVSPVVRYVAPYVGVSGTSAIAIIRGVGFSGFKIPGVNFGATAGLEITTVSDTEIRATYPAMSAGSYAVELDVPDHQGAVPSTATLYVVDAPAYAAQTLSYPAAPAAVRSLIYDAERGALLLATDANGGSILRYEYAGGAWSAPLSVGLGQLQDVALSTDGTQLLAAFSTSIAPVDPVALLVGAAVDAPDLAADNFLKNLRVANDNTAIVTTGINERTATAEYAYAVPTATFTKSAVVLDNATLGMSTNGAVVALIQGDPSLENQSLVYTYSPTSGNIASTGITLNQNSVAPVLDRNATRIALNGLNVYGSDLSLFGTLPETTLAIALKPDGTRAYTYDSAAAAILTFDTSADKDGEAFDQVGTPTPVAGDPGSAPRMIVSPDGGTLFIAGSNQIVIQPTPAS